MIPFELSGRGPRGPVVVVLVLEKENLDRMREADPLDLQLRSYAGHMRLDRPIRDLDFIIAYEEDLNTLMDISKRQDLPALLKWIERGRKNQPGDGEPPHLLRKT